MINKAAYMVVGIDLEGCKDVLGVWIGENESSNFWLTVLNELKSRGVEDILITCVDNLKGFSEGHSFVAQQLGRACNLLPLSERAAPSDLYNESN